MEIKDLGTVVELGCELADVRGGARARLGNIKIKEVYSFNESKVRNGSVFADTTVKGSRSAGSTFSDIGAVVTYAPETTVTQTSGNAFDISSMFQGLNLA